LLAVISAPGQQAGLHESGSKLPHSKTTDCRSHHQEAVAAITRASHWLAKLSKLRGDRARGLPDDALSLLKDDLEKQSAAEK
jgi:hypothetical protein